jgi:hypothetical protein
MPFLSTGLHVCGMNFNVVCIVNAPLVRRPRQPVDKPAFELPLQADLETASAMQLPFTELHPSHITGSRHHVRFRAVPTCVA